MKLVLVIADSLRADAPGYAGGEAKTPTLDSFAAESARFSHCFCAGSWTVPSVSAMFTGRSPERAGVCNWRHDLAPGTPSLASVAADAGFEVEVVSPEPNWWFAGWPGIGRRSWSLDPAALEPALRAPGDRLVVIHHWNTHFPYILSDQPLSQYRRAMDAAIAGFAAAPDRMAPKFRSLYLRAVAHFSEEVLPRIWEAATAGGQEALICVTADHGESHGEAIPPGHRLEHVYDLHGRWMSDATLRVPLLLWGRTPHLNIPPGLRGGVASGVDVAPTLAEAAGLELGPDLDGRSLLPCLGDGGDAPGAGALTVATHNVFQPEVYPARGRDMWRQFAWSTADARWIWDSATDQRSQTAPPDPDADATVWARLRAAWERSIDAVEAPERALSGPMLAAARRLRALGYLDGG